VAKAPTMNDVAREAGVALKTVSRFVNGATNIDPALAARIAAAIDELGYRRNLAAASIRPGQSSRTIGLIIEDIGNPYYSALARAIERVLRPLGYMLMVSSSEEDAEVLERILTRHIDQRVDGLLVVPPRALGEGLARHSRFLPPTVLLDRPEASGRFDTVLADNLSGAAAATTELIGAADSSLAFVGDSLELYTMAERLRGFRRALRAARLPVRNAFLVEAARTVEDSTAAVDDLLHRPKRPTGLFCANNRSTLGALLALAANGVHIPVIGFDDFEGALVTSPPTSVVAQDIDKMGADAARLLLERINGDQGPPKTVKLPTQLLLRGSHLATLEATSAEPEPVQPVQPVS